MLIKHINAYAINKLKYVFILLVILGASLGFLASYYYSNVGQDQSFREANQSLQAEIQTTKRRIVDSGTAIEIWKEKVKAKHDVRNGVQVDFARTLLNELKDKYKIQGLTISLSAPEDRKDMTFNKNMSIQFSTLKLTFVAPTDINAYLFIYDLQNQLPGYLQIKDISFIAINEVTQEVIKGIERGDKNDIVSVKTEMLWQDFKDKANPDTQNRSSLTDFNLDYLKFAFNNGYERGL